MVSEHSEGRDVADFLVAFAGVFAQTEPDNSASDFGDPPQCGIMARCARPVVQLVDLALLRSLDKPIVIAETVANRVGQRRHVRQRFDQSYRDSVRNLNSRGRSGELDLHIYEIARELEAGIAHQLLRRLMAGSNVNHKLDSGVGRSLGYL